MIESHYSLNVSRIEMGRWTHYCRIHLGTNGPDARAKARTIKERFGFEYKCDLTYVECVGTAKEF